MRLLKIICLTTFLITSTGLFSKEKDNVVLIADDSDFLKNNLDSKFMSPKIKNDFMKILNLKLKNKNLEMQFSTAKLTNLNKKKNVILYEISKNKIMFNINGTHRVGQVQNKKVTKLLRSMNIVQADLSPTEYVQKECMKSMSLPVASEEVSDCMTYNVRLASFISGIIVDLD